MPAIERPARMKRGRRRVAVFAFAAAVGCWSCAHRPVDRIGQDVVRASNEAAFHSGSTSPPYAMIRIVDGDGRAPRVVCVDPHFIVGALMRERGVNETAAIAFALDPPGGAIGLERGAADLGRDGAMTEADRAQARKALQPYSDRELRVAYSRSGAASDAGRGIPRAALACALIERGLRPVMDDRTGVLVVPAGG